MSTYIPGITDAVPETPLYHPDMGYFNQMLMKKTQMYNQGLSQVQNAYSSVLNAPLSDQQNVSMRNDYVKQAQDKLKDLSSADLSLDANVQAANNVFAPFWQDDLMLKDVSYTKNAQSEMQKGLAANNSTDPTIRNTYNETSMRDIQNGLSQLQGAGRDPEKYAKLQTRRYLPGMDIPGELDKAAKDEGFKIDWTSDPKGGPYLVEQVNGERSVKSFRAFALGHTTPQMQEQFKLQGRVDYEDRLSRFKANNPGMTDQQAAEGIAHDYVNEYADGYKRQIDGLQANKDNIDAQIKAYKAAIGPNVQLTPDQDDYLKKLTMQASTLDSHIKNQTTEYTAFKNGNGDSDNLFKIMSTNPEAYLANMAKNSTIENWSIGKAANESQKITENPAYKTNAEIDHWKKQDEIESQKLNLESKKLDIEMYGLGLKYPGKTDPNNPFGQPGGFGVPGSGVGGFGGGAFNPSTGKPMTEEEYFLKFGHITGNDTNNAYKTGDPAALYAADRLNKLNTINEKVASPSGVLGLLKDIGNGVTGEDLVNAGSFIKNKFMNKDYEPTKDEEASGNKVMRALVNQTHMSITGPGSFRNAILKYATDYFQKRTTADAPALTKDEFSQFTNFRDAQSLLDQVNADDRIRTEQTSKYLAQTKDPDLKKLIVNGPNGQRSMITANDIARDMPALSLTGPDGSHVNLSPKEVADLYIKGKIPKQTAQGTFEMDGNNYSIDGINHQSDFGWSGSLGAAKAFNDLMHNHILPKYGSSEKVNELLTNANKSIIPNLPSYNAKTGGYGVSIHYDIPTKDDKNSMAEGTLLAQELANPSNRGGNILVNGEISKDSNFNNAILAALDGGQDSEHHYLSSLVYHTRSAATGGRTIEVKFNQDLSEKDNHQIGGVKVSDLAGKTIEIPIADNASGSHINALPTGSNSYVYGRMMNGEAYRAPDMVKAMGVDYTVKPNDPHNPDSVYVYLHRKEFKDGKLTDVDSEPYRIYFTGDTAKNPDEIMQMVNNYVYDSIQKNNEARKLHQNNMQNNGTGKTIADY